MASEKTWEIEGKVLYTSAKSRLVEESFTGTKYWIPKKCTLDFNESDGDGNFIFVVNDWWYRKRGDFIAQDRERAQD